MSSPYSPHKWDKG